MFKLLPEESKEKIRQEYMLRRAVVSLWAFIFLLIIVLVGLFPTSLLSKIRYEEIAARAQMLESAPLAGEAESLIAWQEELNLKLKLMNPKLDNERASPLMEAVLDERGSGIRYTRIEWNKRENAMSLELSGIARDRQVLLSLEKRLNDSGEFASVALPISNLAKEKDINFVFKLAPKP
jgi:hypothetical protein